MFIARYVGIIVHVNHYIFIKKSYRLVFTIKIPPTNFYEFNIALLLCQVYPSQLETKITIRAT